MTSCSTATRASSSSIPPRRHFRNTERSSSEKVEVAERLGLIRDTASTTSDGRHIILSANIELPGELDDVSGSGAEGVGLYRTEFLYLNRAKPPDEEEQFENYRLRRRALPTLFCHHPHLDIGGDKPSESLEQEHEQNPFLGCRAIRYCLQHPNIFKPQLRAILRAAADRQRRIMYPDDFRPRRITPRQRRPR
mgnify:CR=1 FL=1